MQNFESYYSLAIDTLKKLINTPSLSREENLAAEIIEDLLKLKNYKTHRHHHNVWAFSKDYKAERPTLLLNSHLDTVKPSKQWTKDPFKAEEINAKLYGLGSNDAGASLVSLLAVFLALENTKQSYNRVFVASAEEEISGLNGFESIQGQLGAIQVGIVGEPTQMQMAIAEKGLLVLDCEAKGRAGHAARDEGINAISLAMKDIHWLENYRFEKESNFLGPVKMTVSQINAGTQHNVVPDSCKLVVDVRFNECYTNKEVYEIINKHLKSEVKARSFRLNSSGISLNHPIVKKGISLNMGTYGSPTTSDQALMKGFPTIKLGPGDSARSHSTDEFIYLDEIKKGMMAYWELLNNLKIKKTRTYEIMG